MDYDVLEQTIDNLTDAYPHLHSGPGHIVFSDYNYEEPHVVWCLDLTRYTMLYRLGVNNLDTSHLGLLDLDMYEHLSLVELAETYECLFQLAIMWKDDLG